MTSSRVRTRMEGRVAVIELDDGKVNAMQAHLLGELAAALDTADANEARSVVITGRPGFFSAGLDMKTLPTLATAELRATLQTFGDLMLRVFLLDKPVVAAITGHAIAGGAVLALASDRRVMGQGEFKIGLNEVPIGVKLPAFVADFARLALPVQRHSTAVMHGVLSKGAGALDDGWVEEIVDPADKAVDRAVEIATQLGQLPPAAYVHTKRLMREPAVAGSTAAYPAELDGFMSAFRPNG